MLDFLVSFIAVIVLYYLMLSYIANASFRSQIIGCKPLPILLLPRLSSLPCPSINFRCVNQVFAVRISTGISPPLSFTRRAQVISIHCSIPLSISAQFAFFLKKKKIYRRSPLGPVNSTLRSRLCNYSPPNHSASACFRYQDS